MLRRIVQISRIVGVVAAVVAVVSVLALLLFSTRPRTQSAHFDMVQSQREIVVVMSAPAEPKTSPYAVAAISAAVTTAVSQVIKIGSEYLLRRKKRV